MTVLILQHVASEGPALIREYLEKNNIEYSIVDSTKGIPSKDFELVIILGGPMSANDTDDWLKKEIDFIKDRLKNDKQMLGICLGAQLIAKAAGAKVFKNEHREFGYYDVELTEEGMADEIFSGFEQLFPVFQLHDDTFSLPDKAELLATAPKCENQAYRLGNAYGFQFHMEVCENTIRDWVKRYNGDMLIVDMAAMMEKIFRDQTSRMLDNLFRK